MKTIFIINGPNLNLLGTREPEIYGYETLEDINSKLKEVAGKQGVDIKFFQSNIEGELINWLHRAMKEADGVVINPAGYSHTSLSLLDALKMVSIPIVEVHLSNIFAREECRHFSITAKGCDGIIAGLGVESYVLGLQYIIGKIRED